MDEAQRREVYSLFCSYEKLKRDLVYYDECDLVYNIAGRISLLTAGNTNLLPIDSLFVDEVQDFTQAELYIMTKLCRDPNSLFLAGDTAQSIAGELERAVGFNSAKVIDFHVSPLMVFLSQNFSWS